MRKGNLLRIISLTLIFILFVPILNSIFTPDYNRVYAEELNKKDAYQGLALTLLLAYFLKQVGDGSSTTSVRGSMNYTDDELYWLAKVVHAEGRGEPYQGQIAIAAVVLNRVESDQFPDTIYSVIHQKKQFSSVGDGQINLEPNKSAYQAAREAFNGKDPSYGALYFYNPKTAKTLWWLLSREKTVEIGNHAFAR